MAGSHPLSEPECKPKDNEPHPSNPAATSRSSRFELGVHQSAYGSGAQARCSTNAHSVCSGSLEAFSLDPDYRFNTHFDTYLGAMYNGVHDGMVKGYIQTTNINPTIGVRYKF
jgi:predicted porin